MGNVDLGGSKKQAPSAPTGQEKQKALALGIPAILMMMYDLKDSKNIRKYSKPLLKEVKKALSKKEMTRSVCSLVGVKTPMKLKKVNPTVYNEFKELFGSDVLGE